MATIPAHENEFPSLLFVEAAAPATPGTGLIIAYAKAGGVFAWKDDAGVEHIVGEGDTAAHLADTTDAHDASAVSFDPTGLSEITGTEVQTALEELDAAIAGLGGGATFSGAKVYTTGVSISDAVVTFASEVYDTDAYHDTGSNTSRLTAPATGKYLVTYGGFVSRVDVRCELRKNGNPVIGGNKAPSSVNNYQFFSDVFDLAVSDYVEVFGDTVAATTFGDNGDIGDNFTFSITFLGA